MAIVSQTEKNCDPLSRFGGGFHIPDCMENAVLLHCMNVSWSSVMKCARFRILTAIMITTLISVAAQAQDSTRKGTISSGVGYNKFYDDEGSLGAGPTYQAGAEWRPWQRFGLEAQFVGIHFARTDYFHVRGHSESVCANAVYYFSKSTVQPYIKGGIGMLSTRYAFSWPASSSLQYQKSKTGAAVDIGAGIRFFLNRRWSLSPEVSLAAAGEYFVVHFSMKAAYHW